MKYLKEATTRHEGSEVEVSDRVATMLAAIQREGEAAVRRFAEELDGVAPASFRIDDEVVAQAADQIPEVLKNAIDFAEEQVRNFAHLQRATLTDLRVETRPGVFLGHRHIPVRTVGCYVPGGRYSLIASAYMSVIPARVAGVEKVAVCTPPSRDGSVHPGLLYAASSAGADAIYALGGVQALGAMAFGHLPGFPAVDMIVGPGNQYVVEAKRQLFGRVGIDLLAGPTEIGIIADDTADPFLVCCDLVGQAEHDPQSRAVLITSSLDLGTAVVKGIEEHLQSISTQEVARSCWVHGGEVILVENEDELIRVADEYALEHVEVHVRDPLRLIERLRDYGALFVGEETTVAYGDKVSGTNHILPTHRAARFTGGLWVGKFLKTVTFQYMGANESLEMARHCEVEATAEGMVAHARTARVRLERYVSHDVAPR